MQPKKAWWESAMQRDTEARAAQPSYYGCAGCFTSSVFHPDSVTNKPFEVVQAMCNTEVPGSVAIS